MHVKIYVCIIGPKVSYDDYLTRELESLKHFTSAYDVCFLSRDVELKDLSKHLPRDVFNRLILRKEAIISHQDVVAKVCSLLGINHRHSKEYLVLRLAEKREGNSNRRP